MSKESTNPDVQIEHIKTLIEALKRQRKRFGRLISILRGSQEVLGPLIMQYIELCKMKQVMGHKLIQLPQDERRQLEQLLGSKTLETCETLSDETLAHLTQEEKTLTIEDMGTLLTQIDALIVDLLICIKQLKQRHEAALHKTKALIRKKVIPICFGLALIGADIPLKSLPTMIGGGYIIYSATLT